MEHIDLTPFLALRDRDNASIAADFEWHLPLTLNIAIEACDRWAADWKPAMHWLGRDGAKRNISFAEMKELSDRAAGMLVRLGVGHGDRVFTMLPRQQGGPEQQPFPLREEHECTTT